MMLDPSSSLWGIRIREIREACFHLHKVGAQVGNPLQCYLSAEEGTTALRAALAVVEHIDSNLCQDTCFLSGSYKQDFANKKSKISGRYDEFEHCKNRHDCT